MSNFFAILLTAIYASLEVDYLAPTVREVVFVEGDENGKLDCSPISILDDDDFEAIEVIEFYIEITSISSESTLLGELSRTRILINDTGGYFCYS